jgi:hypothetical protein
VSKKGGGSGEGGTEQQESLAEEEPDGLCLLDWQSVGLGEGTADVAFMAMGALSVQGVFVGCTVCPR